MPDSAPDPTRPFWFDWDYDADRADTGTRSRYGNYLYQRTKSFEDIWTDDKSIEFAATAWRIATSPILVPPLICGHPRVISVSLQRSEWDGEMIADVRLISPRPQPLIHTRPPPAATTATTAATGTTSTRASATRT